MTIYKHFAPLAATGIVGATVYFHADHLAHAERDGATTISAPLPRDIETVDTRWPLMGDTVAEWSVGALTTIEIEWPCERWTGQPSVHEV